MSDYIQFSVLCPTCGIHCFETRGIQRGYLIPYLMGIGDHLCVCGMVLIPDVSPDQRFVVVQAYWPPERTYEDAHDVRRELRRRTGRRVRDQLEWACKRACKVRRGKRHVPKGPHRKFVRPTFDPQRYKDMLLPPLWTVTGETRRIAA